MSKNSKQGEAHLYYGALITSIALFFLLILFGALGRTGNIVKNFLLGTFGFALYGITIASFVVGVLCFFKFVFAVRITKLLKYLLMFFAFLCLAHVVSSKNYVADGYKMYIHNTYFNADTACGVLFSAVLYPLIKLNYIASVVIFGLLFIASIVFCVYKKSNVNANNSKTKNQKPNMVRGARNPEITDFSKNQDKDVAINEVGEGLFNESLEGKEVKNKLNKKFFKKDIINYSPISEQDINAKNANNVEAQTQEANNIANEQKVGHKTIDDVFSDEFLAKFGKTPKVEPQQQTNLPPDSKRKKAFDVLYGKEQKPEEQPKKDNFDEYMRYTTSYQLENFKNKNKNQQNIVGDNKPNKNIFETLDEAVKDKSLSDSDNLFDDITYSTEENDENQNNNDYFTQDDEDFDSVDFDNDDYDKNFNANEPKNNFNTASGNNNFDPTNCNYENKNDCNDIEKLINNNENFGDNYGDINGDFDAEEPIIAPKNTQKINQNIVIDDIVEDKTERNSEPLRNFENHLRNQKAQQKAEENAKPPEKVVNKLLKYIAPPIDMLLEYDIHSKDQVDHTLRIKKLENGLTTFGINAKVVNYVVGPTFTRYELTMPSGVSVKKLLALTDDISMFLEAKSLRIEAPIPGRNVVGLEVANDTRGIVSLKGILQSKEFNNNKHELSIALGMDIEGENVVIDLAKAPHLLIAGTTGSGKSVAINTLILSLMYKYSPNYLKLILIDPKNVELNRYSNLPHLLIKDVISEPDKVLNALDWAINEMQRRYKLLKSKMMQKIADYNKCVSAEEKLPYIVIVVDELAELMLAIKKDLEEKIQSLTQLARAAGIHLVFATQRPSVDIITGIIKSNIPSRIAFSVFAPEDSKTILDSGGAEKLLGNGDMLLSLITAPNPHRLQGAFVDTAELNSITNYIREHNSADFDEEIEKAIFVSDEGKMDLSNLNGASGTTDELFLGATRYCIQVNSATISKIQRKYGIGFPRAARLIDTMESLGVISPQIDNKPREIYMTLEEFNKM
ncbi:MAG: DNA translocase FtsK, partial [Clostridia bacterium]